MVDDAPDVRQTEDRTIFVKNLPFDVTEVELKTLFINATEIRLLTRNNGTCRGKAFIEMNEVENAENAASYGKWDFRGRKLDVDLCGRKSKNSEALSNLESATLSIKANMEFDLMDLEEVFTDPCDIRIPKNGLNLAYVQFDSVDIAKKYMEGEELDVNGSAITLKYVPDRHTAEKPTRAKGIFSL